jgi:myo-inositol-1(or 4)-monophosphatase
MEPSLQEVIQLAQKAGEILQAGVGTDLKIQHKGRIDLVTKTDKLSEDYLLGEIKKHHPHHTVFTEESGHHEGDVDHCWYIDPLDGTANYAHGLPMYCVSIAYAEKQQLRLAVVLDPTRPECFSAEQGKGAWLNGKPIHVSQVELLVDAMLVTGFPYHIQSKHNNLDNFTSFYFEAQSVRRLGSAALDLCYTACGRTDGYWQVQSHAWDMAAGALIVREAGGIVTNVAGDENILQEPYCVVAATPQIHPKMLQILQKNTFKKEN